MDTLMEPSLDDFKKLLVNLNDRPIKPNKCKFAKWLDGLSEDKREIIDTLLASPLGHSELFRELAPVINIPMCKDTMRTHRSGACACR